MKTPENLTALVGGKPITGAIGETYLWELSPDIVVPEWPDYILVKPARKGWLGGEYRTLINGDAACVTIRFTPEFSRDHGIDLIHARVESAFADFAE